MPPDEPHHDPVDPHHDPEPEPHGEGEHEGSGFDPLVTNPYHPGGEFFEFHLQARDVYLIPEPVPFMTNPPPEIQPFKEAVTRIQESCRLTVEAIENETMRKTWVDRQESAFGYKACLPDFRKDVVTMMRDEVAKTADDNDRNGYQGTLNELFQKQDEFVSTVSKWDKARRDYPFDWDALTKLQNELNSQLGSFFYKLKQLQQKTPLASGLGKAIGVGQVFFNSLRFELGRQGSELTTKPSIQYGSASEAVAKSLADNTVQNNLATKLSSVDSLASAWKRMGALPKSISAPIQDKWGQATRPMERALEEWSATTKPLDYDKLINKTGMFLKAIKAQRTVFGKNPNLDNVPRDVIDGARDGLNLLSDEMVNRLNNLMDGADLDQQLTLQDLIKDARNLRESTTTELRAKDAVDQGLSDFWSRSKDQILGDMIFDQGKELSASLDTAFNENLGGLLDKWSAEIKKVPNHNAQALHDAAWDIRFAVRRYRNKVDTILPQGEKYREYRLRLLTSLDALQVAVSNQLREAYQQDYYLF